MIGESAVSHEPEIRRLTKRDYYRMAEIGILGPDERTELLEGVIYTKPPSTGPHYGTINRLSHLLLERYSGRAVVHVQNPVTLDDYSVPEPDVALLEWDEDFYRWREPSPSNTLLAIEVAVTSLRFDLGRKAALNAQHGVAELWVVDVLKGRVTVHREPGPEGYAEVFTVERGDALAVRAFPDESIPVDELVGPARPDDTDP